MTATSRAHKDKLKGLYAITDENLIAEEHFSEAVESALLGGVRIIQYRDKSENQKKGTSAGIPMISKNSVS